jgi:hypothetical protein
MIDQMNKYDFISDQFRSNAYDMLNLSGIIGGAPSDGTGLPMPTPQGMGPFDNPAMIDPSMINLAGGSGTGNSMSNNTENVIAGGTEVSHPDFPLPNIPQK